MAAPADGTRVTVEVEGRRLSLSNLAKTLYPPVDGSPGFSKAEVLDYYTRIAPVLLPHLAGRALTRKRYPNGVDGPMFFSKKALPSTPSGQRVKVAGLPATCGRRTGAIRV